MGSYSHLVIGEYPIFTAKNGYHGDIVSTIFQPEDFIEEKRKLNSRNILIWGDTFDEEKDSYTFKGFRQSALVCLQRLQIHGINFRYARKLFTQAKKLAIHDSEFSFNFPLSKVSFKEFLTVLNDIISTKDKHYEFTYSFETFRESLILLELQLPDFPSNVLLYLILSQVDENTIIEYDLTDVIDGGWVKKTQVKSFEVSKTLILTEGKTDVEFISGSMQKLYPHLIPYYHFIDFSEHKIESNASALVKLVTSFTAAKVQHPMIVIFDNDTTGLMEMAKLKSVKLDANIKVLRLPDLSMAKKYPTVGPTGRKAMNINGYACGIELYFGIDCLTDEQGEPIPVHWKAYNEKEGKYQGEINQKGNVQNKFREKLKSNDDRDFSDMDAVLKSIFNAFQSSH